MVMPRYGNDPAYAWCPYWRGPFDRVACDAGRLPLDLLVVLAITHAMPWAVAIRLAADGSGLQV